MKQRSIFLKAAVVASSVLLVGLLVCYRAGAFNWLTAASPPPAVVGTNVSDGSEAQEAPRDVPKAPAAALMPGSKSAAVIVPPTPPAEAQQRTAAPPTILPGSKSAAVFEPSSAPPK